MNTRLAPLKARWRALAPRERVLVATAGVDPRRLSRLRRRGAAGLAHAAAARRRSSTRWTPQLRADAAPGRRRRASCAATPPVDAGQAAAALQAATARLGERGPAVAAGRPRRADARPASATAELRDWLAEAALGRARPHRSRPTLTRGAGGYSGTIVVAFGAPLGSRHRAGAGFAWTRLRRAGRRWAAAGAAARRGAGARRVRAGGLDRRAAGARQRRALHADRRPRHACWNGSAVARAHRRPRQPRRERAARAAAVERWRPDGAALAVRARHACCLTGELRAARGARHRADCASNCCRPGRRCAGRNGRRRGWPGSGTPVEHAGSWAARCSSSTPRPGRRVGRRALGGLQRPRRARPSTAMASSHLPTLERAGQLPASALAGGARAGDAGAVARCQRRAAAVGQRRVVAGAAALSRRRPSADAGSEAGAEQSAEHHRPRARARWPSSRSDEHETTAQDRWHSAALALLAAAARACSAAAQAQHARPRIARAGDASTSSTPTSRPWRARSPR
ncbi:MAG: hypothetical protein MZW92_65270 [Comamonadaceae bacterium]|nr:hypothetical protein [Comamonadaceae bacterium]